MKALTVEQANYIKGYANALQDLMRELTGRDTCAKSYDPFLYEEGDDQFHSYAFNMKDGGRHHDLSDYKDVEEITEIMLAESVEDIKAETCE